MCVILIVQNDVRHSSCKDRFSLVIWTVLGAAADAHNVATLSFKTVKAARSCMATVVTNGKKAKYVTLIRQIRLLQVQWRLRLKLKKINVAMLIKQLPPAHNYVKNDWSDCVIFTPVLTKRTSASLVRVNSELLSLTSGSLFDDPKNPQHWRANDTFN